MAAKVRSANDLITMQTESQDLPPPVDDKFNGFFVGISAPGGPRMWVGPPALLWDGRCEHSCEIKPQWARRFEDIPEASNAAGEVMQTFKWGGPSARPRIVEIVDVTGVVHVKCAFSSSGMSALRLL